MGLFDLVTWAVALIGGFVFAWGVAVMVPPHDNFRVARSCFWFTALILWGYTVTWGALSKSPTWVVATVAALMAAAVAVALVLVLRTVLHREQAAAPRLSRPIAYEPAGISLDNGKVAAVKFGVVNNATDLMRVNVASGELRVGDQVVGRVKGGHSAIIGKGQTAFWQIAANVPGVATVEPQTYIAASVAGVIGEGAPKPATPASAYVVVEIEYDDVPPRGLRHSRIAYEFPPGIGGYSAKIVQQDEF